MQTVRKKSHSSVFAESFQFSMDGGEDFAWDMEDAIDMAAKNEQVC